MAAEITVSASLEVDTGSIEESLRKSGVRFDQTTGKFQKHVQSIGTSEEAIDLGEVTSLGYIMAINLDNTNFVSIRTGTGLGNAIRLDAKGGVALFKAGSGMTAPFAIADTAACLVVFLILST